MNVRNKVRVEIGMSVYEAIVYKKELEADGVAWVGLKEKDNKGNLRLLIQVKEEPCLRTS